MNRPNEGDLDRNAVDNLAALMKTKLRVKREAGFHGWKDPQMVPPDTLSRLLHKAVSKGDPVDVANYCAMIAARPDCKVILPEGGQQ